MVWSGLGGLGVAGIVGCGEEGRDGVGEETTPLALSGEGNRGKMSGVGEEAGGAADEIEEVFTPFGKVSVVEEEEGEAMRNIRASNNCSQREAIK